MKYKGYWLFAFLGALALSLLLGLAPYILYLLGVITIVEQDIIKNVSPVGGMFGPASAFFSGFALIAVIVSIQQQRETIKIQSEELELTRKEIKESTIAQQQMAKHQKNAISLEVILPFMNEISSIEMRQAIITLTKFGKKEHFDTYYGEQLQKYRTDSVHFPFNGTVLN